jgi:hypothetical protein
MSGVVHTYYVWSVFMCNWCLELLKLIVSSLEFMCNWCLELLRLIVSSLSSCVADVWTCSDLLCPATHELREDTISLSNTRHQIYMNTEDTIQTSVTHEHRPDIISMNNSRHQLHNIYYVWSVFMCNWCLDCVLCVHVFLMSGIAQTYCVLSEFMCSWCLDFFRLVMPVCVHV